MLLAFQTSNLLSGLLQFFKGLNVTADQKKFFKKALHSYYDAVTELLLSEHNVSLFSEKYYFVHLFFFVMIYLLF